MTDFFIKSDISRNDAEKVVSETLKNCDDGELYLENSKFEERHELNLPLFVKPNKSGSSFGVQKVKTNGSLQSAIKNALKYDNEVIIEEEIKGKEISCGVFSNKYNQTVALPLTEIISNNEFFDYKAKYEGESKWNQRIE